jgi:hypothetical protein
LMRPDVCAGSGFPAERLIAGGAGWGVVFVADSDVIRRGRLTACVRREIVSLDARAICCLV